MHTTPTVEEFGAQSHSPFLSFSNLGDVSPIDAIWYTPLAQCANWFSSPQDWVDLKALIESDSNSPDGLIFRTFFQKAKEFDGKLTLDLMRDDNFTIARAAFRDQLVSNPTPYDIEVAHGILQLLVMDRLLYFRSTRNRQSICSPISTSLRPFAQPDDITQPYVNICLSWRKHITHFIKAWDSHQKKTGVISRNSGNREIVSSLTDGLERSMAKTMVAKVEENFCLAVLAMRALLIVSDKYLSMSTSFSFDI